MKFFGLQFVWITPCCLFLACGGDDGPASRTAPDAGDAGPDSTAGGTGGTGGGEESGGGQSGGGAGGGSGGGGTGARDAANDVSEPPAPTSIGETCDSDADCPEDGVFCLRQDGDALLGGGPQNGVCVADCSADGQADCERIDPNAVCIAISQDASAAACVDSCFLGTGFPAEQKCLGRPELACSPTGSPGIGFCRPACTNDEGCAPRVCDLGLGVCVDPEDRPDGLPLGSECDPDDDECRDACVTLPGGDSVCAGTCRAFAAGCGVDPESSEPWDAMCLFNALSAGAGDEGLCGQLCDCNDDCRHPDARCVAFPPGIELIQETGRSGYCGFDVEPGIGCGEDAGAEAGRDAGLGADAASEGGPAPADASSDVSTEAAPSDAGGPDSLSPADAAPSSDAGSASDAASAFDARDGGGVTSPDVGVPDAPVRG